MTGEDHWKTVMAAVPATDYGKDTGRLKYTTEHVQIIERHSRQTGKLGMDILIDEWGTSGRVRPTCEVKGVCFCLQLLFDICLCILQAISTRVATKI